MATPWGLVPTGIVATTVLPGLAITGSPRRGQTWWPKRSDGASTSRVKGTLLVARWPITFMVRILLAHEFSVLRATEVTLTREVINVRGNVYPYD